MMKYFILAIFCLVLGTAGLQAATAADTTGIFGTSWHLEGRMGYDVGGTAPVGMPASIRKLNKFPLKPNLMLSGNAIRHFDERWGMMVGIRFENKSMETDATVKNYHMEISKGGETLAGQFTGNVVTSVTQWMFSLPLQATCDLSNRLRLRMGPYLSVLTARDFSGYAYDGYLRVDDPTGAKVNLGSESDERGDYDFSAHMRHVQWGIGAGADLQVTQRFGFFSDLNWGLSGIHKSDFHTVEQTLYPIYGTLGITYQMK